MNQNQLLTPYLRNSDHLKREEMTFSISLWLIFIGIVLVASNLTDGKPDIMSYLDQESNLKCQESTQVYHILNSSVYERGVAPNLSRCQICQVFHPPYAAVLSAYKIQFTLDIEDGLKGYSSGKILVNYSLLKGTNATSKYLY